MTRLALCLLLLATGASAAPQPQENVIDVQHEPWLQASNRCWLRTRRCARTPDRYLWLREHHWLCEKDVDSKMAAWDAPKEVQP
ncbi:hypothetical protein [Pseudomonas putida]|uniref:hypothetical protein n=1 Tax=Pseudomonas putida TaxID=303 RepID=UPI0005C4D3CE|nr:hypothetical protein [Pseudomonas putida]